MTITTLAGVAEFTEAEILALHGVGPKALLAMRAALRAAGLKFWRADRA